MYNYTHTKLQNTYEYIQSPHVLCSYREEKITEQLLKMATEKIVIDSLRMLILQRLTYNFNVVPVKNSNKI